MNFFEAFERQHGLYESARAVQRAMQASGEWADLAGRAIGLDLQVLPDAEDDGFFTFVVNLLTDNGAPDEAWAGRMAGRVLDEFFKHLGVRHDWDTVENVRGYLLGCEIRVNGRALTDE